MIIVLRRKWSMNKRLLSLMLAATMVLSSSVLVSAAEEVTLDEQSIEVVDLIEGEEPAVVIEEDGMDSIEIVEAVSEDAIAGVAFDYAEVVEGYNVKLHAEEGVLPEGVSVSIKKLSESDECEVSKLIGDAVKLSDGDAIAKTVTFDITFTDVDGNVVEPEGGKVNVAVDVASDFTADVDTALAQDGVASVEVQVYHVDDDNSVELVDNVPDASVVAADGIAFDAADFSKYSLIVITHQSADTTKPEISSITVKNSTYTKGSTKQPKVVMDVYDDDSGIKEVQLRFTNTKDSNLFFNVTLEANEDEMYEAKIDVNDSTISGKYIITNIAVGDYAGNYLLYTEKDLAGEDELQKSFTVKNDVKTSIFKPKLNGIKFSSSKISLNKGAQTFSAELTIVDQSKTLASGVATFVFKPAKGGKEKVMTAKLLPKSADGNKYVLYTNPMSISYKTFTSGKLVLEALALKSSYSETYDYSIGAETLPAIVCTIEGYDLEGPKCSEITFDAERVDVTRGTKEVSVRAKVSDKLSGVESIDMILTNGDQTIIIDNFKKADDTLFKAKAKFSSMLPEGTYVVGVVNVHDNAGNSTQYNSKNMPAELKIVNIVVINMMSYNIAFNANGGKGKMATMEDISGTDSVRLTANKFTRKGYVFESWNTERDGSGKKYHNKAKVTKMTHKDGATVTLYAQWKPITYNIKFDANGGKGSMTKLSKRKYGKQYTLSKNKFTRSGYEFVGWNTKKNGKGKSYDNMEKVKNLTTKNKSTVTLYAIWKKK